MHPLEQDLKKIYTTAIRAVDPDRSIRNTLALKEDTLVIGEGVFQADRSIPSQEFSHDLSSGRLFVVGAGKGSARMAKTVEAILGDTIHEGVVITKYGYGETLSKIRLIEAGHPIPDENGLKGSQAIETLLSKTRENDLVLTLISGGGSSLMVQPAEDLTLKDKQSVTELLLACGATIQEINTVRKHLSGIKGGRLARMASPARVLTLILSDVIGDDLSSIASGPTAPDDTTYKDALSILSFHNLTDQVPPAVLAHLKRGTEGSAEETPDSRNPLFQRVFYRFIGSNQIALEAAAAEARLLGYQTLILTHGTCGEAREIARFIAAIGKQLVEAGQPISPPACILSGGEPTVTLRGTGKGGRNQEFALAAGLEIEGIDHLLIASVGTDGTDGPTDAAGGYTDGNMVKKARERHWRALDFLRENNAYPFLDQLGYLIKTGPTGTNVMDIQIILCQKP